MKRNAFTVLELLVSMSLLALLLVLLLNMVSSASTLWRSSENRAEAYREARAAMSVIARDFSGTVAATNGSAHFLLNNSAKTNFSETAIVYDPSRQGAVLFLAAIPLNAQARGSKSDVCQVGYFLAFEKTSMSTNLPGGMPSLNLYRYFLSSDPAYTNLLNAGTGSPFPPAIAPTDGTVDLLARNIREFRLTPLVATNGGFSTNFSPTPARPLPDLLEISLTAVSQEAARRLTNRGDWTSASPARPITEAQQTFTTRLRLTPPL